LAGVFFFVGYQSFSLQNAVNRGSPGSGLKKTAVRMDATVGTHVGEKWRWIIVLETLKMLYYKKVNKPEEVRRGRKRRKKIQ
jgi:hypothetical protein